MFWRQPSIFTDHGVQQWGLGPLAAGYDQHYLHQLFSSAMCLQVPGPSIESFRLYESLEANMADCWQNWVAVVGVIGLPWLTPYTAVEHHPISI